MRLNIEKMNNEDTQDKRAFARTVVMFFLLMLGFVVMCQTRGDEAMYLLIGFGMWMIAFVISIFNSSHDY